MTLVSALVVLVLTLLTALYVAAEFAAVSVRRSRVRQLAEDGHRLARRLRPIVENPRELDSYIAASQIGITLTSLVIGAYGEAAISPDLARLLTAWLPATPATATSIASGTTLLGLTMFNVILGELMPKSIALQYPTQTALATVVPMQWSLRIYGAFIRLLNGSGLLLLKILGIRQTGHRHIHSPEELELLIAESRDGGLLEPDEHVRLQRALRLRLRTTRELMVPWARVEKVDAAAPVEETVGRLARSPFTRIPVYRGEPDIVVGILNTKRLALRVLQGHEPRSIEEFMQPTVTVTDGLSGDRLLEVFRARRTQHAVVVDNRGRAIGLVTLDDVLTEFLGAVGDEFKTSSVRPVEVGTERTARRAGQGPGPGG
jgi:putative hemolysin